MVLYSKFGSQFSGEKNDLKIRYLVAEILSKNGVSFFWTPCMHMTLKLDNIYMMLLKLRNCELFIKTASQDVWQGSVVSPRRRTIETNLAQSRLQQGLVSSRKDQHYQLIPRRRSTNQRVNSPC